MIVADQQPRLVAWLCGQLGCERRPYMTCIGNVVDMHIRGVVGFDEWNGASVQMHVAGEGNWATKELLRAAFAYPFEQLKAKTLLAYVAATNIKSVAMCHHVGFRMEHVLKDAHPDGDLIIFSMRPWECRYLTQGHRHGIEIESPDGTEYVSPAATAAGGERRGHAEN